ncbi:MAG: translation initiation factor IF-2 [Planctomycetes bacterium]|nr:translation initiation factor IF-2 [Planctomycetota bacterium]
MRRAAGRVRQPGAESTGWRDRDLAERQERLAGATGRRIHRRRSFQQAGAGGAAVAPAGPKTEATVHEPIQMKEFCSSTGLSFIQLFKILRDEHNLVANINMILPAETAELLALHFGIELTVIEAKTKLDEITEEFAARERKNLEPRTPVVTMLGHVDHGKTSLLDAIRSTRVAAREDGGITQHIGAHYVVTEHGTVTFLDTPGHAAFTAMRARGAQVTDVVVLVIAADDGVMPQTIEAINHAKAAEVAVVVALNKIDLGDQNKLKIYGQLAEHGLTPSGDWGGEIDVIETSATTGTGIPELIEHLSDLSALLELKADPTLPAQGAVIEAETKSGVGAVVRVLVREETLRVGSFVVCGNASGKVRALHDDRGQRITEAGPSVPVEVWGLDDVPMAGDALFEVSSLQRAKEVASETKHRRIQQGRLQSRKVRTLEEMLKQRDSQETPELNLIIKADVDGSVTALKQILSEIPSEEVRLTVRHAGVGAVNDSDVLLAEACKGIVVAFRVEASVGARRLAEQHGVDIRPYRVIYNVADDVKKALEGLLAPELRPETRGVAEVRQVFHLSRGKGVVAGSFISEGTLNRNHLAKVIRDGVVVREGCEFASIRRFKDDVREVRSGMECGIRLEGFDDIHVGDIIEAYEILKIARTL